MAPSVESPVQIPLIHVVESDDVHLERQSDLVWFGVLRALDWQRFVPIAVGYYEALWRFNQLQAEERVKKTAAASSPNPETREEAALRLLFERPTLDASAPVLDPPPRRDLEPFHVNPADIRPGRVPIRIHGRTPKCFFAIFKAFMGMALRGRMPEPEEVDEELHSNPGFARTCGFTLPNEQKAYRQSNVPSLRKLEQFDQIMADNGLWEKAKVRQVKENLKTGRMRVESTVVHDTTHFKAWSSMRTVEIPVQEGQGRSKKSKRKSHPRTTKNCRCKDRKSCPHPWVSADPGAGTVSKAGGKMHWAHKASTLSFANQEVILDAAAMSDAASHDSKSLRPHIDRLFKLYPSIKDRITRVLDDSAADDKDLKEELKRDLHIELLVSPNPRGRKPIKKDLPRGIDHIRSAGTPVCVEGIPFDFLGCRHTTEHFLFRAPLGEDGKPVCEGCARKSSCCRDGGSRRQIVVPFQRLPWIDPRFPQLSRRFQKAIARRTVIERIHKLMKFDYGDERLTKRGNRAFQSRLDKTLLAMHLVIASP